VAVVDAHFAIAQIDQRTNVALTHLVDFHGVDDRTLDIVLRPRHLDASNMH